MTLNRQRQQHRPVTAAADSGYRLTINGGAGTNTLVLNDSSLASTFSPNPPQRPGYRNRDVLRRRPNEHLCLSAYDDGADDP